MDHADNENIRIWKERAAIDYVPLFMNLWLCLNALMTAEYPKLSGDRDKLNDLKMGSSPSSSLLLDKFKGLMGASDINATLFRSYFAELHHALVYADIRYHLFRDKIVRFDSCLIDYTAKPRLFESILVQPGERTDENGDIEQEGIRLDDNVWVERDTDRLFKAYIEIVYQVRCHLFHGDLVPNAENHRVIRLLYLTLILIMEDIG